ncbi:uncharacterized protein LOC134534612 [Bacillus rossius redtenbacheri]|uniref:uncharacterized protein LOC134534612 n=1 Tax=Bacillus rossius redtenbacheri TaxID=93214 RepID=UPI002FDEDDD4
MTSADPGDQELHAEHTDTGPRSQSAAGQLDIVTGNTDHVTAAPDHVTGNTDHVTASRDHVTVVRDHVTGNTDHVTAARDHVTGNTDHVTAAPDHVTGNTDHVTASRDHVTVVRDHVTGNTDHVTAARDHVKAAPDQVTVVRDHVTAAPDHVTGNTDHVTAARDHVKAAPDHVTATPDYVTSAPDHVTGNTDHVTAAPDQVTVVRDHVTAAPDHVTGSSDHVAGDSPVTPQTHKKRRRKKQRRKKGRPAARLKGKSYSGGNLVGSYPGQLDSELAAALDLSCLFSPQKGRGFIKAPQIPHSAGARYTRRRNTQRPHNRYLVAVYECSEGHALLDPEVDRLYCSAEEWVGERPVCQATGDSAGPEPATSACGADQGGCEHVCSEEGGRAVCSCFPGYEQLGQACRDVDECQDDKGGCEGVCVNKPGSFSCSCHEGLRLAEDHRHCLDINECLLRNGHGPCQDTCSNLHGGYSCSCDGIPGTRLSSDNHTCEDVDECAAGTAGCSHTCISTMGRTFCLCPAGYELGSDWKTCQGTV